MDRVESENTVTSAGGRKRLADESEGEGSSKKRCVYLKNGLGSEENLSSECEIRKGQERFTLNGVDDIKVVILNEGNEIKVEFLGNLKEPSNNDGGTQVGRVLQSPVNTLEEKNVRDVLSKSEVDVQDFSKTGYSTSIDSFLQDVNLEVTIEVNNVRVSRRLSTTLRDQVPALTDAIDPGISEPVKLRVVTISENPVSKTQAETKEESSDELNKGDFKITTEAVKLILLDDYDESTDNTFVVNRKLTTSFSDEVLIQTVNLETELPESVQVVKPEVVAVSEEPVTIKTENRKDNIEHSDDDVIEIKTKPVQPIIITLVDDGDEIINECEKKFSGVTTGSEDYETVDETDSNCTSDAEDDVCTVKSVVRVQSSTEHLPINERLAKIAASSSLNIPSLFDSQINRDFTKNLFKENEGFYQPNAPIAQNIPDVRDKILAIKEAWTSEQRHSPEKQSKDSNNNIRPEIEYISTDPRENEDNYNPDWNILRRIDNDSDRYKEIQRRWRNLCVPEPNKDLSYRHSNNKLQENQQRPKTFENNHHRARSAEGIMPTQHNRHQRSMSCTDYYEKVIRDAQRKAEEKKFQLQMNAEYEMSCLMRKYERSRSNIFNTQNNLVPARTMFLVHEQNEKEANQLKELHMAKLHRIEIDTNDIVNNYTNLIKELKTFNEFYNGVNEKWDNLELTEEQQRQLEETEQMYEEYSRFYK